MRWCRRCYRPLCGPKADRLSCCPCWPRRSPARPGRVILRERSARQFSAAPQASGAERPGSPSCRRTTRGQRLPRLGAWTVVPGLRNAITSSALMRRNAGLMLLRTRAPARPRHPWARAGLCRPHPAVEPRSAMRQNRRMCPAPAVASKPERNEACSGRGPHPTPRDRIPPEARAL